MFGFGKPNVEKMERKKDVEGLIKALGYEKDTGVRSKAAIALGNIRDVFAFEPLIKALHDPESIVRGNAAEALGKIGDQRAVEPLIQSLYDSYIIVHSNAARALDNIGWKPGKDENTARYWIVKKEWTKCVEIGVPAVESLICVLDYYDDNARLQATKALGNIGDARAIDPLIKALNDSDNRVRSSAAEALGKIGDARAVEPLIKALGDQEEYVYEGASEALIKIGRLAVEPLVKALKDSDQNVRKGAAEALGKIGDARAVKPLIQALSDSDTSFRMNAAEALGEIGPSAIEPLIKSLSNYNRDIRRGAAEVLEMIGWKPGKDEIAAQYWIAKGKYNACIDIGTPAIDPLIKSLSDYNQDVRERTAWALGKIGWEPGKDVIAAQYRIAKREWSECSEIGTPAIEPLAKALKDSDSIVRVNAALTLGKIGDAAAVEPLIKALDDSDADVRARVAEALRNFSNQTAVSALKEYDEAQKKKKSHEYSLTNIISNITLIDARNLGNAGSGGAAFQAAIQKLNQQDYYGAERDFLNAISIGLDSLRQGYAYAEIGNIKLKQNDLDNAIRYFLKVFENGHVLYESADTASKYLSIIYSEMGRAEEAQVFTSIAAQTTGKLGYSLSPDAERRVRQLVRENN